MTGETERPVEDSNNEQLKRIPGRSLPNILKDGQLVMIFGGKRPPVLGKGLDSQSAASNAATNNVCGTDEESTDWAGRCSSE